MAYRRRHGITRASTFKEEIYHQTNNKKKDDDDDGNGGESQKQIQKLDDDERNNSSTGNNGSLAARAMRASAAHRDSSAYGYAYGSPDPSSSPPSSDFLSHQDRHHPDSFRSYSFPNKGSYHSESISNKDSNETTYGFWGILARKAKSILDDDDDFGSSNVNRFKSQQFNDPTTGGQFYQSRQSSDGSPKMDNAKLRKRLDAITTSLNNLGDTIGTAFEEGRTKTADIIQETRNKTADILQETRRLQIRRRGGSTDSQDQATVLQNSSWQRPVIQPVQTHALANQETQLKASRDVAMATAAKAKVLLRELKTLKADLAFAKQRCAQLEEENKRLRESCEKGDNPADDDLIRLQLETLLAEKARMAHENSIYARENRFLREIVEYHQLTMQDIVYLDEGAEEVTEVYPFSIDDAKALSSTPTSPVSPTLLPEVSSRGFHPETKELETEVPKEVPNTTTSSSQSSPPKASPLGRKVSSAVATSSQRVEDERQLPHITELPTSVGEDPKRLST